MQPALLNAVHALRPVATLSTTACAVRTLGFAGSFRAGGPMQLAGDSEAKSTAGAQAFSAWTVERRTVVSMSSGGPVVRLELSHPYLSSQGRAVAAADWSLTGCGKYVMVRVPLRALDKYLRAREKADAQKKQQQQQAAASTTLEIAALSPSAYVLTPGGFRSGSPAKGSGSPAGFASPATSASSSPPSSPSPLGGTRFFALSASATPLQEASFKGPRLPTFANRSKFAVTSNRSAHGSGSTFAVGSPGALSPHTSPPLVLAPRSRGDSQSILALSPATVGRSDLDPCSPTSPLSATTNEAALSSVRSGGAGSSHGALAKLGFSKRFGLGSFRNQNRVAPAPVSFSVESFPKAAPVEQLAGAAAVAPSSTAAPAAEPTRALASVPSAAGLRPSLSQALPGDGPVQPRRASGSLPPISPVRAMQAGGGTLVPIASAGPGSYGIDVHADSPASIVAASRMLTTATRASESGSSTIVTPVPATSSVHADEAPASAAGHDASTPLPGQVELPASGPLSHSTSATNATTPSSPRGGAPPLTLSTHAGSASSAAGTTPIFALSSPNSIGGAVAARMAASRLLGSLSPKSPGALGRSAAGSASSQDAAPALPSASHRRSRLRVKVRETLGLADIRARQRRSSLCNHPALLSVCLAGDGHDR